MNRRDGGNNGKCGWRPYVGWHGFGYSISSGIGKTF